MLEEKNTKFCSNCGAVIDINARTCPTCGAEQPIIIQQEEVSNLWYVLAFFLGIVGGVIAWAVNKDRNPKKAVRFLIAGFILPIILVILQMVILPLIILSSTNKASDRAKSSKIMASMAQMRAAAEMIHSENDSYSAISCTHPQISSICEEIKSQGGTEPIIHSAKDAYCAYVKLPSGSYSCIDSKLNYKETSVDPSQTGYCDGKTFVCPN